MNDRGAVAEMRYVIVDVAYYPDRYGDGSHWEPTPAWFGDRFPQRLTITDDTDAGEEYEDYPDIATRKFVGLVSEPTWQRFADDWCLTDEDSEPNLGILTEYGHLPGGRWNVDGMDFNLGGVSLIAFVDVSASPTLAVEL